MSKFFAKVSPATNTSYFVEKQDDFYVISLSSLNALYGRFVLPQLHSFEELKKRGLLKKFVNIKSSDTVVYVSHETSSRVRDNRNSVHIWNVSRYYSKAVPV